MRGALPGRAVLGVVVAGQQVELSVTMGSDELPLWDVDKINAEISSNEKSADCAFTPIGCDMWSRRV